jgi:hypothetical protein
MGVKCGLETCDSVTATIITKIYWMNILTTDEPVPFILWEKFFLPLVDLLLERAFTDVYIHICRKDLHVLSA